ncbi:hypothetical protein AAAC51_20170 [Priestia megaterium]
MKEIQVEVIQGRGSYRELGEMQGKLHKGTKLFENHQKEENVHYEAIKR